MQKTLLYLIVIGSFLSSCGQSNAKNQQEEKIEPSVELTANNMTISVQSDDKSQAIEMIREFYTNYIVACDKTPFDPANIENIKNKYLTKELLEKLANAALDFDPFLNAQDCDAAWIETLEVTHESKQENIYTVCYTNHQYNGEHTNCMMLLVVKNNGKYRINDIVGIFRSTELH
jgi:hypothetical protein